MECNSDTLFIRLDRIGDLILSLPVDQHHAFSQNHCHWIVSTGLEFVMDHADPPRNYSTLAKEFSWRQLFSLIGQVKKGGYKQTVVFHAPWWIGLALVLAGVKNRVGRYSQWHSFLFFNKGIRQKRSLSEKSEYEYNLDLVALLEPEVQKFKSHLYLTSDVELKDLKPGRYYVVHPGMSGSALNWSPENYAQLIERIGQKFPVVITGTEADRPHLEPVKRLIKHLPSVIWKNEQLSGSELISVCKNAVAVIAPSTGVVHIAASTGVPTVGLYSNVQAESWQRWGPLGDKIEVLHPSSAITPEKDPKVMDEISVDQALKALHKLGAL
jgi:ADP-heptose:LPS heptosyltransferase